MSGRTPGGGGAVDPPHADAFVTVRYWAGARAVAGVSQEQVPVADLDALLDEVVARHGADLARVLERCSVLVDGVAAHPGAAPRPGPGSVVEVLPPFAGG